MATEFHIQHTTLDEMLGDICVGKCDELPTLIIDDEKCLEVIVQDGESWIQPTRRIDEEWESFGLPPVEFDLWSYASIDEIKDAMEKIAADPNTFSDNQR